MDKTAPTTFPIHGLLAERWSPVCYAERAVSPGDLASLLEAARWAPSCFNEQPWRFLVARADQGEDFERLASCLVEGNRWAKRAPVLLLSTATRHFARNGKPNPHAWHDVGLAMGNLTLQAQSMGLSVHQMGGFDAQRAREVLTLPDDVDPVAMAAIGYAGGSESAPEALRKREAAPRQRRPLDEIVFGAGWGRSAPLPDGKS